MTIKLTAVLFKKNPIVGVITATFGQEGGSIGRSEDNTFVLSDAEKFVSRHHANIHYNNGYYLSDTSLGGIYINGGERYIHNDTVRLENNMRLRIGEYEIQVEVIDELIKDVHFHFSEASVNVSSSFLMSDETVGDLGVVDKNSLMNESFPRHEDLVLSDLASPHAGFKSSLLHNHAPTFDSYIAPSIVSTTEAIPENLSFDDFFGATEQNNVQVVDKPSISEAFEDFFGSYISEPETEAFQTNPNTDKSSDFHEQVPHPLDAFSGGSIIAEQTLAAGTPFPNKEIICEKQYVIEETIEASDKYLVNATEIESAKVANSDHNLNDVLDEKNQSATAQVTTASVAIPKASEINSAITDSTSIYSFSDEAVNVIGSRELENVTVIAPIAEQLTQATAVNAEISLFINPPL